MRRTATLAALALTTAVGATGCARVAESRLNPFNWFGRSAPAPVELAGVADPRPLVAEVTGLRLDPTPEGAILTATGLPPRQGFWDAGLIPVSEAEGTRVYQFRLFPPPGPTRVSTPRSREVTAALFVPARELAAIRAIRVEGAGSARAVSR